MATASGIVIVDGIGRPTERAVTARPEPNSDVSLGGTTDILLSDFAIPVVSVPFVTMEDSARSEALLTLSPHG